MTVVDDEFLGGPLGRGYQRKPRIWSAHGLYEPEPRAHSCGVGFVAAIDGKPRREVVQAGIDALKAVWHRGAVDADGKTGDGAGIHLQIAQEFFKRADPRRRTRTGRIAVGMVFLPRTNFNGQERCRTIVETEILGFGYTIHGWRQVPVDTTVIGDKAIATRPEIEQIMIGNPKGVGDDEFERELYLIRRRIERRVLDEHISDFYICSISLPLDHLQGPVPGRAAVRVLSGPARRALRLQLRDLPPALLDQHLAVLAAGPAVPDARPQRRDQHPARQRELDEEPRDAHGGAGVRRPQRGHQAAGPGRQLRQRGARCGGRGAGARRAAPCRWSRPC